MIHVARVEVNPRALTVQIKWAKDFVHNLKAKDLISSTDVGAALPLVLSNLKHTLRSPLDSIIRPFDFCSGKAGLGLQWQESHFQAQVT